MNPIEPRVQATLDAAMNLIRTAATSAAMRVAESLDLQAQNTTRPAERELIFNAMQELRRNLGVFQSAFHETLRERISKDLSPQVDNKRKFESADWETLSLVDVQEVETQMNHVRLGQLISVEQNPHGYTATAPARPTVIMSSKPSTDIQLPPPSAPIQ